MHTLRPAFDAQAKRMLSTPFNRALFYRRFIAANNHSTFASYVLTLRLGEKDSSRQGAKLELKAQSRKEILMEAKTG
jgi:hypothetical protein